MNVSRAMMEKREFILRLRDLCPIQCLIFGQWFGLNTLPPLWWLQSCGRRVDPSVKHTSHMANQEHMKPQQAMAMLLFQLWVWHTGMATQYGNCRFRCVVSLSIRCFHEQNRNCWTYVWHAVYAAYTCTFSSRGTQILGARLPWYKIFMVAPNICGSLVWNLLFVTVLAPRILRWLLDFWKIIGALLTGVVH